MWPKRPRGGPVSSLYYGSLDLRGPTRNRPLRRRPLPAAKARRPAQSRTNRDVLLLLEHSPVITSDATQNPPMSRLTESLAARESRSSSAIAGDVTFHGPGNWWVSIFDLRDTQALSFQLSALSWSLGFRSRTGPTTAQDSRRRRLRSPPGECSFAPARFRNPDSTRDGLTGAWTVAETEAKIAAIGVHISRSVTSHGFALNVNTDLSYFNLIVPCGIAAKPVTSMQNELRRELDLNEVAQSVSRNFGAPSEARCCGSIRSMRCSATAWESR